MTLEDRIRALREERARYGRPVPHSFQGVAKERVASVLAAIDCATDDMVDAVYALLDEGNSWFARAPAGLRFADGATTAHIGTHVGVLQRGGSKLDREGRDYWIRPLRDMGAIEAVYFYSDKGKFIPGHPVAKSPNSAYRLSEDFVDILKAGEDSWPEMLAEWVGEDRVRERANLQAQMAERSRRIVDTKHSDLIALCASVYVPKFLPGYRVLFVDEADGERVTTGEISALNRAGVTITLADAMPDILLWNPSTDWLWVVEAVTSDGEVDAHKVVQMNHLAGRSRKAGIGFTTAYASWRDAARRQGQHKNIAPGTFVWIAEDPSKQLHVLEMLALVARGANGT